jgi:TorA maturation chaperone TorD
VTDRRTGLLFLLAHGWLHPLAAADWAPLAAVPDLAVALPDPTPRQIAELAEEQKRLLQSSVPPRESPFLGAADEASGTPDPRGLIQLYREASYAPPDRLAEVPPDHIGLELLALAHCQAAHRTAGCQLVSEHLALWVPAMAWALRRLTPAPFYSALAEITLDTVLARLEACGPVASPWPQGPAPVRTSPTVGCAVGALLDPSQSGCYVSRAELQRLAQWLCLRQEAGSRAQALEALLDGAAASGLSRKLLVALEDLLDDARLDYDGLAHAYPAWQPYRQAWARRLDRGAELVAELGRLVRGAAG